VARTPRCIGPFAEERWQILGSLTAYDSAGLDFVRRGTLDFVGCVWTLAFESLRSGHSRTSPNSPETFRSVASPEALARIEIDAQLKQAGWVVQDFASINIREAAGVAVREFILKKGHGWVDYLLYALDMHQPSDSQWTASRPKPPRPALAVFTRIHITLTVWAAPRETVDAMGLFSLANECYLDNTGTAGRGMRIRIIDC
jgi:hypothetical protein